MFHTTFQRAGIAMLAAGLAFTTIGVMAQQGSGSQPHNDQVTTTPKPAADEAKPTQPGATPPEKVLAAKTDEPDGLSRIESLRKELVKAASREWEQAYKEFVGSSKGAAMERAYQGSKRLMHAQAALAHGRDAEVAAATEHFGRVRELARVLHSGPSSNELQSAQLKVYAAEAELWVAQATADDGEKHAKTPAGDHSVHENAKDPATQRILARLEEPISMSFHDDTPLEDVLKYIQQATTTSTHKGIPIYVDPLGLQEAEKSMTSTVRNIDLEGVPLRRTLQLLLKQIGLVYFVEDGMLCITSEDSAAPLRPSMHEPSPILQKAEKAERGELSLTAMKELVETLKIRREIANLASGDQPDEPSETKQGEELKQYREQVNLLLKEIRGLLELLKAERQREKASGSK